METISFPGLGLSFNINRVAFSIGSYSIAWYGIIIAAGLLLALIYGLKVCRKRYNVSVDDLSDVVIWSIIFGIIGARLYYCLFYVDAFKQNPYLENPISMLYVWEGGLGIYGGIIAALTTAFIVCKIKKISVGAVFDVGALGLLIGQAIGRWGNFINQECYGPATNLPWRMVVSTEANPVHPCFLYESLWCILGFVLLHIYSKRRKFNGEIFLIYIAWYAFGRYFIEGLRTDSLMLGNLKVSQLVAALLFVGSIALLIVKRIQYNKTLAETTGTYETLFDDTAKAVEADTAEAEAQYGLDDSEDDEAAEDVKPEAEETTETEAPAEENDETKATDEEQTSEEKPEE